MQYKIEAVIYIWSIYDASMFFSCGYNTTDPLQEFREYFRERFLIDKITIIDIMNHGCWRIQIKNMYMYIQFLYTLPKVLHVNMSISFKKKSKTRMTPCMNLNQFCFCTDKSD